MADHHPEKGKCRGKERLIQAAQILTREHPFDDITIDEIIKTAELSRPAFYYHFTGGKEELRAELVQRGTLPETPAQDTQQAILEAALRVFARAGTSAATMEDIAAEAGVTRGTLLWHFHSKDDLLSAIIKHYGPHSVLRPVIESIEQDLSNGIPLDDESVVRRLVAAFYDGFTVMGDYARLAILLVHTHPEAARLLAEKIVKGRKTIIEYVQKRQEEGSFCQDIDPAFFVQVISLTCAMRAVGQGLSDLLPLAHLSREDMIDQFVTLLLYGIVQRDSPRKGEPGKES
ncbi:MAG TPA: TetR family transcriptional regulator [Ktedonobacteraceae bacterium]|nr:TetR family transcriptional regulator [Ktedonobacteraceae bacterium]